MIGERRTVSATEKADYNICGPERRNVMPDTGQPYSFLLILTLVTSCFCFHTDDEEDERNTRELNQALQSATSI